MVTRETSLRDGLARLGIGPATEGSIDRLLRLHEILLREAIPRGFVGPEEGDSLLERHVLESAALLPHLVPGPLVDVGSGAGLPGLVLGCLGRSPLALIEAERRRAVFLRNAARELDLDVAVIHQRAEAAGRDGALREAFRTAVARALATPPVALEYLLPLVGVGGRAVLAVGPAATAELDRSSAAARALSGEAPQLTELQVPGLRAERWAMIVVKGDVCPERYPRRAGVPARKPLGDD